MAFLSFLDNSSDEIVLLLDIGNGTVTGAFVYFKTGQKPKFIGTSKMSFPIMEIPDSERLMTGMSTILESMLVEMMKTSSGKGFWKLLKVSKALVTFSSPWFILKTKNIHLEEEKEFVITKAFLDDIVEKEEKKFEEELKKEAGVESQLTFQVVERSIMHTKINGYALENTLDKKTKAFDAMLCMSIISNEVIESVTSYILKYVHIPKERVLIHSFPLASFTVVRDMQKDNSSFFLMDITGEVTDMTIVDDNIITQTATIPSGRNFLIRQIVKSFDSNSDIAESILHMYLEKKLDDETSKKVETILIDAEKEWSIYFESALTELSPTLEIPNNIYLTADDDVAQIFIEFLNMPKTDATSNFRRNAKIHRLDKETLINNCNVSPGIHVDEFILILAIFYNKMMGKQS